MAARNIAIVLQTHFFARSVANMFARLQSEMPERAKAYILMHVPEGTPKPKQLERFPHHFVTTPEIRTSEYPNKSGIGGPWRIYKDGNVDLTPLHFFRAHSEIDWFWFIEYDMGFSGSWSYFFSAFEDSKADLITTTLHTSVTSPEWMHWASLNPPDGIRLNNKQKIRSFMPIIGVSRNGLAAVDKAYREGWNGHMEVTWPTIIKFAGLILEDIGGEGEFVREGNQNRFYTNNLHHPELFPGSMTFRPILLSAGKQPNKLWHPIKPLSFKLKADMVHATPDFVKEKLRILKRYTLRTDTIINS